MASLLELKQLSKQYGATLAVDHLDLTVQPGQIYAFLGPNGAGKTTTIRMMLGLVRPSGGQVWFQGQPLDGHPERVHAQVGSMVETPGFYPFLSGAENLHAFQRLHGANDPSRIKAVLELVDLASAGKKPVGAYSLGMKQRLGVALALLHRPQLLILDEPTNGLDPAGRIDMLGLIRRIGTEFGISVLVTSHLLGELEQISDHIVVIDGGRLLHSSSTAAVTGTRERLLVEVTERPEALVAALVGAGVTATLSGRMIEVEIGDGVAYDLVRDRVADLGVGLVRIEQRRHRIAEIFRAVPSEATVAADVG